jgi:uncharacterized protein (DUF3084 family)
MTSGYILIGAMLILGGIIAVSGDRIGSRVGKARLTLFKLRPRQTATLVTSVTGTLISGSVLTLIFGASEQLRLGVFDLQKIQRKLSDTKENLARALEQKDRVQRELETARNAQSAAKNLLSGIDKSLKGELLKQSVAAQNFKNTEQQLQSVSTQRNELVREVAEISRQHGDLKATQRTVSAQVQELKERVNELEDDVTPLKQQLAKTDLQKSQLQQQLDTTAVLPNLLRQTQQLQRYQDTARKLDRDLSERTARLNNISTELQTKQGELIEIDTQFKQLSQKLAVRQAQLTEKDKQHQQLERELIARSTQLKLREQQLKSLEAQMKTNGKGLASLEKEVNNIEQEYRKIRQANISILRNQVLASAVVKARTAQELDRGIDRLLAQANLNALKSMDLHEPDKEQPVVEIDPYQLQQLKQQIDSRSEYIVRIFSSDNYVISDRQIQVFADATPNRKLFDRGQFITSTTLDLPQLSEAQIRQQLNILLVKSQLRARQTGILDDRPQIGDGQLTTYVQFLERIKKQKYPIEIKTIVDRDIYTLGPLVIQLQAIANGKVLFSTYSNASIN